MDKPTFITMLYRKLLRREPEAGAVNSWSQQMAKGLSEADVLSAFVESDEYKALERGSQALFQPPGHYYSPIVDVTTVAHLFDQASVPTALPGIALDAAAVLKNWRELLPHLRSQPFSEQASKGLRYRFDNPAYGVGDACIYFAMLMQHRPRRIVEIGSGFSSACAQYTIEHHLQQSVEITFVEPYPALLESLLTAQNRQRTKIIATGVQHVDLDVFRTLESGDFLFIDSTHVLKTGSDVHFELFEVLPLLKPGVFIHFHDVFWPFEYPRHWVIDENRSWNELYALRAFLMHNPDYSIQFFNDYFAKVHRDVVDEEFPLLLRNPGGAIWLRKGPDTSRRPSGQGLQRL